MEELFKTAVERVALGVEAGAALFIGFGAIEALYHIALRVTRGAPSGRPAAGMKRIWVRFAVWLLLALEFELAADVLRSAIAPTWDDVGQLAAIAGIRTILNYFLEKDIEKYGGEEPIAPVSAVVAPG